MSDKKEVKDMSETVEFLLKNHPDSNPQDVLDSIDLELSACARRITPNFDKKVIITAKNRVDELLDRRIEWMRKRDVLVAEEKRARRLNKKAQK